MRLAVRPLAHVLVPARVHARAEELGRGRAHEAFVRVPAVVHDPVADARVGGALAGQDEPAQALVDASESGESLL